MLGAGALVSAMACCRVVSVVGGTCLGVVVVSGCAEARRRILATTRALMVGRTGDTLAKIPT